MSLAHIHVNCASEGCYAVITLHPNDEQRLRRTHETVYCPAGHGNHFAGKTEDQKRIEQLERTIAMWKGHRDVWLNRWEAEHDLRGELTHAIQVCPLGCGWHGSRRLPYMPDQEAVGRFLDRVGSDLVEHLVGDHNATRAPVALLTAGSGDA